MTFEHFGKRIAAEIGIFAFAQGRKRVEPLQLSIDMAGVAHHERTGGQAFEKPGKYPFEIRVGAKRIGAGECRIGRNSKLLRARGIRGSTSRSATLSDR